MRSMLNLAVAALPLLGGCAAFGGDAVPAGPTQTGIAAQDAAWQSDVQRMADGSTTFAPLSDARKAVDAAGAQDRVQRYDGDDLVAARQALAQAKDAWRPIADDAERSETALAQVAEHAHRAQRLAEIARYTAQREINLQRLNQVTRRMNSGSAGTGNLIGQKVIPDRLGDLAFEPGTARLTQPSHAVVAKLAALLKRNTRYGVAIFGFTDNSAPSDDTLDAFVQANPKLSEQNSLSRDAKIKAYNLGLSSARARDVAILLVKNGIDPQRIGARGFGEQHPVASNATATGRSKNRRIEAVIVPAERGPSNSQG